MTDTVIAITLLWIFVFIYAVAASIDFGAGFWSMIYISRPQTEVTNIANRYLSPSWEVTNVFIVLIVVALVSFFPGATYTLGTVLLLPGSLVLLLLMFRSAFMVFSHSLEGFRKLLSIVSGITGLFIPALIIAVLPISQGGFIQTVNGAERLLMRKLFASPSTYTYIAFALGSTLFLSSLLLADYSKVSEKSAAYSIYRKGALAAGPISLLSAILILVAMKFSSPWLYTNLIRHSAWLIASIAAFTVGYITLLIGKPRLSVVSAIVQYLLASYAYGASHMPYIVYPTVTIQSGFTHPETFRALFASYIVGFLILAPGFIYFWRMFMKDRRYLKQQ
ncbi:cytochrome d ubiquinol oxidase subunit II [Effusibacillus dendaii]|uniref:Putative cytochrome bd menaquinol oxidase subunit II n=1 Tax=Effusibacillus dendaii TaxID=2743772 RepID=A0A7I8DHN8_9BACL|nr:cytochrome d ubiquinol oxidase subunit II [Effusibacillus dendaii]BCJ88529.1 putative cytochrome bd menaquinol oxidase subunit II [Effusibacillus dendaii]